MTAEPIHTPQVMPVPAATPKAIRAVLVNAGEPGLLERFEDALDAAVVESRESGSIDPLNTMLRYWRAEAAGWCNPAEHRAFLAKVEGWRVNGVPPESRGNALRAVAELRAKHGPHPAFDKLESLAARP